MSDFPTLPTGPFENISMDYARLREEGVKLLGQLGGAQWTDFNTHDPGITILEQLCYAITDLGYRTGFSMPELLAGGDPGLPSPEAILTTDPVTLADVQRLALDVEGIGNAWVEPSADSDRPFYHDVASGELRLRADPTDADAAPVQLRGIHQVVLQVTEEPSGEAALTSVAARLHAGRALGSDFEVWRVGTYEVGMRAVIEVDAVEDPAALMVEIVERIEGYLVPRARFATVADARAQGQPLEEILDGPRLEHGSVEVLPGRRRTVYVSDLLHAILDVPAVKAVRSLILAGPATGVERWALEIPSGSVPAAITDLTLLRGDIPLRVDPAEVRERLARRRAARAGVAGGGSLASSSTAPRLRDLTRHRSIQYQLPAVYGVGPLGLPASAAPQRRAQARQLAAYLLIFDQLFANSLAQLAHARELLSPGEGASRTYFASPVDDDRLGIDDLRVQDRAAHAVWLDSEDSKIEPGDPVERRKRFLAHLLARFAEELGDHSLIKASSVSAVIGGEALIADRRAFLRDYPRLSRARGSGYDVSRYDSLNADAGFEDRLRHKLGLRGKLGLHDQVGLHVVEHLLLRPVFEDGAQLADEGEPQVPLLAGVSGPDPWSLHMSIVIEQREPYDASFEQLVEQTVLAETPAHLSVRLHWFGDTGSNDWTAFETAWNDFRAAYRDYRAARLLARSQPADPQQRTSAARTMPRARSADAQTPVAPQLLLRDARDRVIDLLSYAEGGQPVALGRTYPLRDLPLPEQIVVASGSPATIPIAFSQKGVSYELCGLDRRPVPGVPIAPGTGTPIALVTPAIKVDVSYRIRAFKQEGAATRELREAWLRTVVRVIEGIDTSLVAEIWLPLLDAYNDSAMPSDARLGDWGVEAKVAVLASQEGVTYEVIENAADLRDVTRHHVVSSPVVGTSGTIVLRTEAIKEDIDLRVRGTRATGDPANPVMRTGILDLVLPLRVRANPAAPVQLTPQVVAYGGAAALRLNMTQTSVEYRVYRGRVRDRDFVFGTGAGAPTIDIPADGRTVRLQRPPRPRQPPRWQDLFEFTPAGDAAPGNGSTLDLAIGAPGTDDAFLLVQATKQHQVRTLGTEVDTIESAVQLDGAVALLVRPNPAPELRLEVAMADGATTGSLLVSGGQPGVFYELRLDGQPSPIARPAYVHQRDDQDDQLNKGIDQLVVEVDAVSARDRPSPDGNPATTPPATPLLDTDPLPAGSVLHVLARKAMSGLEAPLVHAAVLNDMPPVTAEPASIAAGESANIVIAESQSNERYWLLRNGQPVGAVVVGTGSRIVLPTGALAERTVFTVAATRTDAAAIAVERHADVAVDVV